MIPLSYHVEYHTGLAWNAYHVGVASYHLNNPGLLLRFKTNHIHKV